MNALPIKSVDSPKRTSRDEMNLAEFPLTVLSTRADPRVKTLEFRDSIRTRDGEVVNREWIITAADKFGLPTASDDEVLLGLLKLTVDQGMRQRKIFFTRYELLKVLRWTTEGRSYSRLQKALDRLSGVRIKATNAFFDNSLKTHSTMNFGIIDAYEINDARDSGQEPAPSFFIWSEVLFNSFQVGYIKKLDLSFFVSLKSAVSKRLYRYLDKHFWYRSVVKINAFTLAHEKLGVSRNYRFVSSLKQQLDPALEELRGRGFVSEYSYEGKGKSTEVVIVSAKGKPRVSERELGSRKQADLSDLGELSDTLVRLREQLQEALLARGILEKQLPRLLMNRTMPQLRRIHGIIEHFDYLVASKSRLVSLSPIGFLYRAVENPDAFRLPGESRNDVNQESFLFDGTKPAAGAASGDHESELKSLYLVERQKELQRCRKEIEPELLKRMTDEVTAAISKLRGLISEQRFQEAVDLGVEEKLVTLFGFPGFEEWCSRER